MAIDGTIAVVGAPRDGTIAAEAGAAYVYEKAAGTWSHLQTFYGQDIGDQFGYSVAVVVDSSGLNEGDFIAVGSLLGDGVTGLSNVNIYRRIPPSPTFAFQQTVSAGDGNGFDEFGHAIALDLSVPGESLSGDPVYTLVVGAPDDNGAQGQDMGSVYIFQLAPNGIAWAPTAKLVPTDIVGGDLLGRSVAIEGDLIIAGATGWPFGNNPGGVSYLMRRFYDTGAGYFNWEVNNRLTASDGESGDLFGRRVAIDIGVPIVGAPFADTGSGGQGAVYIFGGMPAGYEITESQKILAPDPSDSINFGVNLAIHRHVLVASEQTDPPGSRSISRLSRTTGPGSRP
ncbi:hypothetical protein [Dokdonella sp.]|uniref:hypothetical protein n=1 Tax=Dokdonella sp. TaxID=2291710 RepID=UPI0035296A4F